MVVLISGSREGFNYREFSAGLSEVIGDRKVSEMVAGGARGIDKYAKRFADSNGITFTEMNADWDLNGKKAGAIRNIEMLDYVSGICENPMVVAFVSDFSNGTMHMIKSSKSRGIVTHIVEKNSFDFS